MQKKTLIDVENKQLDRNQNIKQKNIKSLIFYTIKDLKRGGTYIQAKGMYMFNDKTLIYTVLTRRELAILKAYVSEVDPEAFISITDANEILGSGFTSLQQAVNDDI